MNTKIQHDATTLGPLTADSTMAGRLAALPDLVRFIAARDGRTLRDAAILLGDSLGAAADSLELFQTDGGAHARPVTDAAAMLAELRANWSALQGRPLDLTEEPFARLAMRASGAGELFGFGIAHEPTPWLPGALPVHDVNRWGMNRTSEARPRDLVRVADIVPAAAQRGSATTGGLPLDRAAAWVLDGLRQLDAVPWFELRPGREPLALEQCREWRPAYASSAQRRVEYLNSLAELPGFLFLADQPDAEEAAARGLAGSEDTWPAVIGESLN